jgi:hypothetical protein
MARPALISGCFLMPVFSIRAAKTTFHGNLLPLSVIYPLVRKNPVRAGYVRILP